MLMSHLSHCKQDFFFCTQQNPFIEKISRAYIHSMFEIKSKCFSHFFYFSASQNKKYFEKHVRLLLGFDHFF